MNGGIYIDFDDVLCETARALAALADELFGRRVAYEEIEEFDLMQSFDLSRTEYDHLMERAHEPEFLEKLQPAEGAVEALLRLPHVTIVTGRPAECDAASRSWLKRHGLDALPVMYLDKYGRYPTGSGMLTVEEFNRIEFSVAVDDAPVALDLLSGRANCRKIIYDRPWNRRYVRDGYERIYTLKELV